MQIQLPRKLEPLRHPARYKVVYGGRGSAKSWGVARQLLIDAAEKPLRVLCAREIQKTIADSVHQLLRDQIALMGLEDFYRVQETEIVGLNGSRFFFAGIRGLDVAKIKSFEGVDRCWVEEAQVVSKKSWDVLTPTIRKPDSEIWITFNPELDTDETWVRFVEKPPDGAVVIQMNWRDNPWFPQVLERERADLLKRDPESYETVWEGKCRPAVEGAIYRKEIEALLRDKRLRTVPYDPLLKVHTVWDLGWNDAMSIILVQRVSGALHVIEYIEDSHRTLADYVNDLTAKRLNWGTDWLPHDGQAKDFRTGQSAEEILTKMGRKVQVVPRMDVEGGIKAARLAFGRCYFDVDKAAELVQRLKRYRRAISSVTNEAGAPLHDENSHGADAFRYMAMIADRMDNDASWKKPIKYVSQGYV